MATEPTHELLDLDVATEIRPRMTSVPLLGEQVAIDGESGAERTALLKRLIALTDLLAAVAAAVVGVVVTGLGGLEALAFAAAVVVTWSAATFAGGLYAMDTLTEWASGIPQLGRLSAVALLVSWPFAGLATALDAANPVLGAWTTTALLLLLALAGRTVDRHALHRIRPLRQRTVILGSGIVATRLVDRLRRHEELGLETIGLVDDDVRPGAPADVAHLGRLAELREVLERHHVDRVIIAFSRASHEELLDCLRACREKRVAVNVVPRLFEFLEGVRAVEQIGGLPVLSIGAVQLSRSSAWAKRLLDVVVAAGILVVTAPLLALVAAAIKLESRGPVFFCQPRAGRDGRPFSLVKFRSMYDGADQRKRELATENEQGDGVMFKIRRDPRVTRVGQLLRRTSLDELPQLLNVLRGEMSLVGPRPLVLPESLALGDSWHARRLDLRPGITGPWQVSGRSDLDANEMVRLDFQYVTGWSLARDFEILLTTIPAVLSGRGAY